MSRSRGTVKTVSPFVERIFHGSVVSIFTACEPSGKTSSSTIAPSSTTG